MSASKFDSAVFSIVRMISTRHSGTHSQYRIETQSLYHMWFIQSVCFSAEGSEEAATPMETDGATNKAEEPPQQAMSLKCEE